MTIRALPAGLLLPVLLIIGIGITSLTGQWKTESSKIPARYTEGTFEGEANPADIRGSYSFGDIENAFGVPVSDLAEAFGQSENQNPAAVQLKTFEEFFGPVDGKEIGTDSARLFVALYKGLPYLSESTTGLPLPAKTVLERQGADLSSHLERFVDIGNQTELLTTTESDEHEEPETELVIKGKTVFSELLDAGMKQPEIESILGGAMGAPGESIRDWCIEREIEFSVVKEALQNALIER